MGRINTLATADVGSITESALPMSLLEVFWSPFDLLLTMGILYNMYSYTRLPVTDDASRSEKRMKKMDDRRQKVTEDMFKHLSDGTGQSQSSVLAMSMLRMIKLFGWESKIKEQIMERRVDELTYVRWNKILVLLTAHVNFLIPLLTMIATYASFTAYSILFNYGIQNPTTKVPSGHRWYPIYSTSQGVVGPSKRFLRHVRMPSYRLINANCGQRYPFYDLPLYGAKFAAPHSIWLHHFLQSCFFFSRSRDDMPWWHVRAVVYESPVTSEAIQFKCEIPTPCSVRSHNKVASIWDADTIALSFGAAIVGPVSIRAYGAQEFYLQESRCRIDDYVRPHLLRSP